ncbi:hypothetical protein NSA56_11630 [Oceanobacillus caeni]|nr:hypothetical protein [Oceanobacillus caeni]MCR1835047.1 hypothetical protein [Oceanobacillus caeni]
MSKDSKEESMETFVNHALRGKPHLDIDRAITETRNKEKQQNRTE